ncbi:MULTISPECIES: alternative ribosome rescue aminoacyl-tRNA hydrolase ArfB [Vibrio]|uniref:Aminoacyl-tRNA hydrolase n=1 Tax=Vibrio rotiferianus TaxID=190895 RepID=A0A7Y3ZCG4_9VIBR|nr:MULTISPECIES: alternative ribosome rescue aminoacyl-tRNA hydrolase ArfB [Vibrio]MDK9778302.1 aminoacyl-tRNA hydrolase [Vibrio sp. D401a]MDK9806833.1 aminoacyl-tRNA hydrolase [Vibrio sp. D406a]NOH50463.1 aminoacyl-tRNA hydrolase [Vibrio rotiferianus]USD52126.1 aminoacyl-tRNA hydrolase [Vibrio sp. SCSIO 43153]
MLKISNSVTIQDWEIQLAPIRAQGSGGQNVNKVSSAIHLRFDVHHSTLPQFYKDRLLAMSDSRISKEGVVVIKAQTYRTQEQNREDALNRLAALIQSASHQQKKRISTKPTRASQRRRLDNKTKHAAKKEHRKKVSF